MKVLFHFARLLLKIEFGTFVLSCVMAMSMCLGGNLFWPNMPLDYSIKVVLVSSCFNINVCKYVYIMEIKSI